MRYAVDHIVALTRIQKGNAYSKARYSERRAAGLCVDCGLPSRSGVAICGSCSDRRKARREE